MGLFFWKNFFDGNDFQVVSRFIETLGLGLKIGDHFGDGNFVQRIKGQKGGEDLKNVPNKILI